MAILVTTGAVAGVVSAIAGVIKIFNTPRSVVPSIYNHTDKTFVKVKDRHEHGGWAEPPPQEIPPQTVAVFG